MMRVHRSRRFTRPISWLVLWAASFVVARFLLEQSFPTGTRLAIALTPVPLGIVVVALVLGAARRLDELERRIQLEALAAAFVLAAMLLMTLGLIERVVTLQFEDWSYLHVWGMLPVLYLLGLVLARRRYHEEPPQD